jgi:hypothetical protein
MGPMCLVRDQFFVRLNVVSWCFKYNCPNFPHRKFNPFYTVIINMVFWAVSLPSAWLSLSQIGNAMSEHNDHTPIDTVTPVVDSNTDGELPTHKKS